MKKRDYQHVKLREEQRKDNGRSSYVVEWRPERGALRRRRFSDPEEAKAEADHIEKLFSNGLRIVADLSLQQMIGVAMILQHLPNVPLHEVLNFYLQQHGINGTAHNVTVEEAGKQFIESRSDPDNYSASWRKDVRLHIGKLIAKFGKRYVNTIKVENLEAYIADDVGGANRTRLNHITTISAFGNWMRTKKKWFPFSVPTPFEEIQRPKCKTKNKEIYSPEELTRLLVFTPLDMVPFMTIGAFGGMRAAERMRLEDDHWQAENGQFALPSEITKTQRRRIVEAQPNLKEWIALVGHVMPFQNPYDKTGAISKAAGVPWKYNALRSSFASYHLQKFKNEALTAMLDGHSVQELNTSYKGLNGVSDKTADEWFSITPQAVIDFAAANGLPAPEWSKS